MSDVTIVCCYNNEKVFDDFVKTLKAQTCEYDLIGIDNRGNQGFTSCAAAYNSVIDDVKTKYVIFSHQDISLHGSGSLAEIISYLDRIKPDDILGVAGVKFNKGGLFSNIKHVLSQTGEVVNVGHFCIEGDMMKCDTVDECFFGGYTEHFRTNPFNETICNNWHLYAVEACLRTKLNTLACEEQNCVYTCDAKLMHLSSGSVSWSFYWCFFRLCRYYARYFPLIRTTCASSKTTFFSALLCWPRTILIDNAVKFLNFTGLYETVRRIIKRK